MTLTPEQRHTMYCIMMAEIEDDGLVSGFCDLWEEITGDFPVFRCCEYELKDVLPELYQKRTAKVVQWFSSWFTTIDGRITALQQCIKELEKQLYP